MPEQHDFCRDWLFLRQEAPDACAPDHDDSHWTPVHLPHTCNAEDMFVDMPVEPETAEPARDAPGYLGPMWYRKHFQLQRPDNGDRVLLHFEAVANHSQVYVDGKGLGGRDGGFLGFRLDITDALDDEEQHVVAVRADNAYRPGMVPPEFTDWMRYGGIYRPVQLHIKGWGHFDWPRVQISDSIEPDASEATLDICYAVRSNRFSPGELTLHTRLLDPHGGEVDTDRSGVEASEPVDGLGCVFGLTIPDPMLWSPATPDLYTIETELQDADGQVLDRISYRWGFRRAEFTCDRGFLLNGQAVKLRGVDVHQDYPGLGFACPQRFHRRDADLIKQAGMNFVRTSHYPRNERFLDACDELGILVMEEQPFWHGSLRDKLGQALLDNGKRLMADMVTQHGHHPCIICWNTVNEVLLTPIVGEPHADPDKRRKQHHLQPNEWPWAKRGVEVLNRALHDADPQGRMTSVVIGGRWRQNVEAGLTEQADIIGYNGGAMGSDLTAEPPCDILRRQDPDRIHVMTEGLLNFDPPLRADWEHEVRWWKTGCAHWSRIYQRDWFCGGAMWVFADYPANGTYRIRGCVDFARVPYESYWLWRSLWHADLTGHICGHWSWKTPGQMREVPVFTNASDVELLLNGKSLGAGESTAEQYPALPNAPRVWQVPFEPGELKLVARRDGQEVVDIRYTEGKPAGVRLEGLQDELTADGRDVAFFHATVVDAEGNRCFNDFRLLHLAVEGPAALAGPAERVCRGGKLGFAVRSASQVGQVSVTAGGEGLSMARAHMEAR